MPVMWRQWFLGDAHTTLPHVSALDGLRGLAVMIVIASHLSNTGWLPQPGLEGSGKTGVYLFFVLSAYLLSRAMFAVPAAALRQPRYWLSYALRRVLRIWPLYLLVLAASWALTRVGHPWLYALDTRALLGHLTLRQGIDVLWSIPVEFTFYLWLPFIAVALRPWQGRRLGRWAGLALLAALGLVARQFWPAAQAPTNSVTLGYYMVVFLAGMAAAWVDNEWPPASAAAARAWRLLGWLLLVLWLATLPSTWAAWRGLAFDPNLTQRWFATFGIGWALMLLAVLRGGGTLARFFASTPMRLVGVVSFSAYLWHMPVVQAAHALGLQRWGWWAVPPLLAVVLGVAMLSWSCIERPWRSVRLRRVAAARPG